MGPSGFKLKSKDKFIKYGSIQLSPRNRKLSSMFSGSSFKVQTSYIPKKLVADDEKC
jgi:hypothetical protein